MALVNISEEDRHLFNLLLSQLPISSKGVADQIMILINRCEVKEKPKAPEPNNDLSMDKMIEEGKELLKDIE